MTATQSSASARTFRGQTAEERVAARRQALIDAALDLIGTSGWSSATMTAICQRAGLTERYFYESFRNRDALFIDLLRGVVERIEQAVLAAASAPGLSRRERSRSLVSACLAVLLDDPRLGRVALLEGVEHPEMRQLRRDALYRLEGLLEANHAVFLDSGTADSSVPAAPPVLLAASLVGAAQELLTRRLDGELPVTDEQLADHLVELSLAWTGAEPRS